MNGSIRWSQLIPSCSQAAELGLAFAWQDLARKKICLSQSHYGSLKYILAYAASGSDIDIYAIAADGQVSL